MEAIVQWPLPFALTANKKSRTGGHCTMGSADAPADARKRAARRAFISKQLLL